MTPHEQTIISYLLKDAPSPHITGIYLGVRMQNLGDEQTAQLIWEMAAQEIYNRINTEN